jgi:RNA polymerase sigma factor (sigma-70 family)
VPLDGRASDHGEGRRIDPVASDPTPGRCAQRREEAALVWGAIENIPDKTDRLIVVLRFFEELSLQQISRRIGLKYDTVRERYRASMRLLESKLTDVL